LYFVHGFPCFSPGFPGFFHGFHQKLPVFSDVNEGTGRGRAPDVGTAGHQQLRLLQLEEATSRQEQNEVKHIEQNAEIDPDFDAPKFGIYIYIMGMGQDAKSDPHIDERFRGKIKGQIGLLTGDIYISIYIYLS
jgi:hypothetical protein